MCHCYCNTHSASGHTYLGGSSQSEAGCEQLFKLLGKLGGGLGLLLRSSPGRSHHLTAHNIQGSRGRTEVVLEGLIGGTTGIGELGGREGGRRGKLLLVILRQELSSHLLTLQSETGLSDGLDGLVKLNLSGEAVHDLQHVSREDMTLVCGEGGRADMPG